jgi:hypothetical protein
VSRQRFYSSILRSVVPSLVEAAVAVAFTTIRDREGKLLALLLFDEMLLLVDGVGDRERSSRLGDCEFAVSSSKMRPSKIA